MVPYTCTTVIGTKNFFFGVTPPNVTPRQLYSRVYRPEAMDRFNGMDGIKVKKTEDQRAKKSLWDIDRWGVRKGRLSMQPVKT